MPTPQPPAPTQFWEERYRSSDRIWSGDPNPLLVRETSSLEPGNALDLGCGEGGDALWLASRGWRVTGVDIAATALERAAAHAAEAGLAEQLTFEQHELGVTFPEGSFDLVSAQFLQSPVALDQDGVLERATEAVAPGGTLLVVMHAGWPSWMEEHEYPFDAVFPTLQGLLARLALPHTWQVETLEAVERSLASPDGKPGTRTDNVWRLTRTD
ncbi:MULTISPECIES: bifunctional 2-polyprenyl-6-hydroxyphenol methylase/3-demethylubiquinol 3-O-methyltransferase UbiG [unclassified Streptomyces]|uniref:class I SAM-dependent methyltransferase n=1 Tax=unclassified Streptomyces TaxID=2593676 RepID=UPI00202470DE|nr:MULTISPECIES: class I SAM-dependent methyltransferase [unclassified Streptomyces]MCX4552962.1 methyltransferase domain-containing protein [Streptomyces sp. NBC_01500]WSC24287.1 methyltransferase domain-containing protein [Streptomyces sp. NBC_01766]WSV58172.1 methyltransferase domain-containing protein [Streptomyces sp. NBC_01014]